MAADKEKSVEPEQAIEQAVDIVEPEQLVEQAVDMVGQISEYGFIVMDSLYLLIIGMVIIFLLHKLASVVLYPRIGNLRLVKVIIGALYVLVLTITVPVIETVTKTEIVEVEVSVEDMYGFLRVMRYQQ